MEERFKNYGGTAEEQAVKWVGELTGTSEELESKGYAMQDCLKSGIVLCALIERLGGKRIKARDNPRFHRENISQFITGQDFPRFPALF